MSCFLCFPSSITYNLSPLSSKHTNVTSQTTPTKAPQLPPNIKIQLGGFPGGAVVRNPPANAGDMGSSPGPGRSHMPRSGWARAPQLLSLRSRAREPQLLKPVCHNHWSPCTWSLCSATGEATAMGGLRPATKSSPRSLQLEKARVQQRRPNAAKN